MNRQEFQQQARTKLLDARALLRAKRWSGAYYLAGYAVECGLKACILRRLEADVGLIFKERRWAESCWTHNLELLVQLADLRPDLEADLSANQKLKDRWQIVKDWNESSRYLRKDKDSAEALFEAIGNKKYGVMPWIVLRW